MSSTTSGSLPNEEATGTVPKYVPVVSLELLAATCQIPDVLSNKIFEKIIEQLHKQNIRYIQTKGPVLYFHTEENVPLEVSLNKVFKILVALVQKKITLPQGIVEIKAGLDICRLGVEDAAISAIQERLVAQAGQLVVSKRLYELCQNQLPFEILGPLAVNGIPHFFYKLQLDALNNLSKANAPPPNEVTLNSPTYYTDVQTIQHLPSVSPPQPISKTQQTISTSTPILTPPAPPMVASQLSASQSVKSETIPPDKLLIDLEKLPDTDFSCFLHPNVQFEDIPLLRYQTPQYCQQSTDIRTPQLLFSEVIPTLFGMLSQWLQQKKQADYVESPQQMNATASPFIGLFANEASGKSTFLSLVRSQLPQEQFIWINSGYYTTLPIGNTATSESMPLSYWTELLQNIMGLPIEGIPREHFEEHFMQVLQAIWGNPPPHEYISVFKNILGIASVNPVIPPALLESDLDNTVAAFMALFYHLSQKAPVILVMEDIEHADIASLQLLMSLLDAGLLKLKVSFIIATTPNTQFTGALAEVFSEQNLEEWVIAPPQQSDLITIVETPLAESIKKLPPIIQNQLTLPTTLPMYIEESMRLLIQKGALEVRPKENKFVPTKTIKSVALPGTLDAVIRERIAGLSEACKQILDIASILGYRFSNQLLAGLLPDPSMLDALIKELWELGFIVPESQAISQFRHRLIWQIVYFDIDPVQRASQHQYVFSLLEQLSKQNTLHPLVLFEQAAKSNNHYATIRTMTRTLIPILSNLGFSHSVNGWLQYCQNLLITETGALRDETERNLCYELGFRNRQLHPKLALPYLLQLKNDPVIINDKLALRDIIQALSDCCEQMGLYEKQSQLLLSLYIDTPENERRFIPKTVIIQLVNCLLQQGCYRGIVGFVQQFLQSESTNILTELPIAIQNAVLESILYRCQPNAKKQLTTILATQMDAQPAERAQLSLKYILQVLLVGMGKDRDSLEERFNGILETLESEQTIVSNTICDWGLTRIQYLLSLSAVKGVDETIHNELKVVINATLAEAEASLNYRAMGFCKVYQGWSHLLLGDENRALQTLELAIEFAKHHHLSHVVLIGWRLAAELYLYQSNTVKALDYIEQALSLSSDPFIDNRNEYYWAILLKSQILMQQNEWQHTAAMLEKCWPIIINIGYYPLMLEAAELIVILYDKMSQHAPPSHKEKYLSQKESFLNCAHALQSEMLAS